MKFSIDSGACVGCLACVRVCPTDAIAVAEEPALVSIEEPLCVRCGECVPACPHDAVKVGGAIGRAVEVAAHGGGVLILAPEAVVHFHPATVEQVVNACHAAGFATVSRGVIGDELVAAEYQRLWDGGEWGTLIRSTDPVVVETVRMQYPELLPFLAPVVMPAVAEARWLKARDGVATQVVYAGVFVPVDAEELDAAITFADLEQLFHLRGVDLFAQPEGPGRPEEERRRHLSLPGGMPKRVLAEHPQASRSFRAVRGLHHLPALARAVTVDRLELGFVDLLSTEGMLDHPLFGPKDRLYWRRDLVMRAEPPRAAAPVVNGKPHVELAATFGVTPERRRLPEPAAVSAVEEKVGLGPNGRPWDCGACGYASCRKFAEAAALGRATLRQCTVWMAQQANEARHLAAIDPLTGLATYRVLRDRLASEVERSRRSAERFAVLFLDLDHFKDVNDQLGHEMGNAVLRETAEELRAVVRASDLAARYGGDEFVVLLTRTSRPGASRVAEAIRARVEQVGHRLGLADGMVTVSIGVAEFDPRAGMEADVLVSADRALYRAKGQGRNVVC
ncbi:MAG: diguanylate cyclase [Gemmatimonadales bacterium]|nr:diguanylate cyclase [Gemmatimonadales bacterium]